MKKYCKILVLCVFTLLLFNNNTKAQKTVFISSPIIQDTILLNNYQTPMYGLQLDANIVLNTDTSFIRIVLIDSNDKEYLVCDVNILNDDTNKTLSLNNYCCESCYLQMTYIKKINVRVLNANISSLKFTLDTSINLQYEKNQKDILKQRNIENVNKINDYIFRNKFSWVADTTTFSFLPYSEKKKYFGNELPNLFGFEYYSGG